MKNIFLLPTDRPSFLFKDIKDNLMFNKDWFEIPKGRVNQNIYITSDEEIKKGDWVIKISSLYKGGGIAQKYSFIDALFEDIIFKKIILTTDPELIKDGVQAIDEDFLQWFVKNPSCESVEIENNWEFLGDDYRRGGERTLVYKIIIPKEESLNNTKEETLEGVVLSNGYNKQGYGYRKIMGNNTHWITLFISGGFQMYAYYTDDEEMEKIYDTGVVEKITPKELEVLIRVLVID